MRERVSAVVPLERPCIKAHIAMARASRAPVAVTTRHAEGVARIVRGIHASPARTRPEPATSCRQLLGRGLRIMWLQLLAQPAGKKG